MSDLFWPGDERAGSLMSESALLRAMVDVESAWLAALVEFGLAGPDAADDLEGLVTDDDVRSIANGAESGGNPVIALVPLLRERLERRNAVAAFWVHRGLTSQDVLDTALMLCSRAAADEVRRELRAQIDALVQLTERHRATLMAGRTLGQHAVPITFGVKTAGWLQAILDAAGVLATRTIRPPSQFGGAGGTLAAVTSMVAHTGYQDPPRYAQTLIGNASARLDLESRPPWHTARAPVTRIGDAFIECTGAWGRIANDVITLSRPEIAELAEPAADGRGGSSTMPHKTNPVLSVLIRATATSVPAAGAQLHLASADTHDERPAGAWHTEWSALRTIVRHAVTAASQTTELLSGLRLDMERMRATAHAASDDLLAERDAIASLLGEPSSGSLETYTGASDLVIDAALDRARAYLEA